MQTIVETEVFIKSAERVGIAKSELDTIRCFLAENPEAGDPISGTGGARKIRFAAKGKGKSGGYRVIIFFSGLDIPVFLLDIYAKGDKANLTAKEKNILKKILAQLATVYRGRKSE